MAVRDAAVFDQGRLGRGAAHVQCDHVADLQPPRAVIGRQHARRRPGLQDEDRPQGGICGRRQAPSGLHDEERRVNTSGVQLAPQGVQVALHDGPHIGVDDGSRSALVLPALAQHFAGQ